MPLWIGAYLADTQHLERHEHGGYLLMLMAYWRLGGPLPDDDKRLAAITKSSPKEWKQLRPVLEEFFNVTDGKWTHKRVEQELEDSLARKEKAELKAKAAADARWKNAPKTTSSNAPSNAPSIPQALHEECPTPSPTPIEEISQLSLAPPFRPENGQALEAVEPKPPKPKGPPDCPHQDILALWAEVLPALPQHLPEQWRGTRADHLRARWRETATAKGWTHPQEGREYFRRLFDYVGKSPFLSGRVPTRDPTKRPFLIELEWLVNPSNWAKVHEGKYHPEAA